MPHPPQQPPVHPIIRLLKAYLPRHKKRLAAAMVAMLVVSVCLSLSAYYIQPLFDRGLIGQHVGVINTIVAALVGLTLLKGVAYFVQGYFMEYIGQRIIADIQEDLYSRLLKQDLTFFHANPTGTLTSRFISDLLRLKQCVTQIFSAGLRDLAVIIGLLANMIYMNWSLTLMTIFILPPTAIIISKSGRMMRKYARVNQESTGALAHMLNESLSHIRQVQSFTMEDFEMNRIKRGIFKVFKSSVQAGRVRAISSPIVEIVGIIVIGVMMIYAGYLIKIDDLTPGAFASFMASLVIIIRPIRGLTALNHILQEGAAAAERTFRVMDTAITVHDAPNPKPLKVKQGEIAFHNVSFHYADETVALDDISFTAPAGQTIALVGASGAGKSTILNLIPRFFDPTQGSITVDGQNIAEVSLHELRAHIALVSQDVAIFDDTVLGNIRYGQPDATDEQVYTAAKMAAADDFINDLPEGYNTVLGENGVKISGGQKQRIAIARAMIKNAPILLLDEATSNLDTASERQVQDALEKLMANRTTVMIAHRLSTIIKADKIFVLDQGRIAEHGTHDELMQANGAYASLWHMQQAA